MAVTIVLSATLHCGWLAGCRSAVEDFYAPLTGVRGCSGEPEGGAGGAGGTGGEAAGSAGAAGEGGQDTCQTK